MTSPLAPPKAFLEQLPLSEEGRRLIEKGRAQIGETLLSPSSSRILLFLGPCSIHSFEEALEYGEKLQALSQKLSFFFPVMRVFLEKPRTRFGWKGFLYDPKLDGSCAVEEGLFAGRKLLLALAHKGILAGGEFLESWTAPYLQDLFSWGVIGARTSFSQPHRQMASSLPFPVGFKNDLHGNLEGAVHGIAAASAPQLFLTLNAEGRLSSTWTKGNMAPHLILRGGEKGPNFDPASVRQAAETLKSERIVSRIVIDCSHGNSGKDPERQKLAFATAIRQIAEGNQAIAGVMLESYLEKGRQERPERRGVSLTDACLGWEETAELVYWGEEALSRSTAMAGVQK